MANASYDKGGEKVDEFERIYRTYFKDVYLYVRSISQNDDIAEEITAETFF